MRFQVFHGLETDLHCWVVFYKQQQQKNTGKLLLNVFLPPSEGSKWKNFCDLIFLLRFKRQNKEEKDIEGKKHKRQQKMIKKDLCIQKISI